MATKANKQTEGKQGIKAHQRNGKPANAETAKWPPQDMATTEPPKTESEKPALPPWKDSRRHFDRYVWTDREASEFGKWLESAPKDAKLASPFLRPKSTFNYP